MARLAGDGVSLFYASILLLALCWVTFITRVGVRVWRKLLGLEDMLMFLSILLFTVTSSLCIVCCFYGSGQKAAVLKASDIQKGTKLFFIAEFFYATGAALIKCSIAVTLLRIADTRRGFVWALRIIMAATTLSAIIFIITITNICHPIDTLWGGSTTGTCNLKLNSNISLFFSAIEITTDWTLAILPAVLLWNIQMKTTVKISVGLILGLAAFASCATIVRLRYLSLYSDPTEFMFSTGKIGLWSVTEEGIGIFAGSLPALRPLLSLSFFSSSNAENAGPASGNKFNKPRSRHRILRSDVKMDTFEQLGDLGGDDESQKHIMKETQITVTNEQSAVAGEWERSQVLGWKKNKFENNGSSQDP